VEETEWPRTSSKRPAKLLGLKKIPAVVIDGLSEARKRALLLADNRIAQGAGWDRERLADELTSLPEFLVEDGLDICVTGFEPAEIDALLADFEDDVSDPADDIDPAKRQRKVMSALESGHVRCTRQCPLWAKSGLMQPQLRSPRRRGVAILVGCSIRSRWRPSG
jgi:hypothetical protein